MATEQRTIFAMDAEIPAACLLEDPGDDLTGSGSETWPNCQVNLEFYVYKSQLWWSTTTCFLVQFSISIVHSIFVFAGWTNIKFPATEGTLMTTYWIVICNMMVRLVLTARKRLSALGPPTNQLRYVRWTSTHSHSWSKGFLKLRIPVAFSSSVPLPQQG